MGMQVEPHNNQTTVLPLQSLSHRRLIAFEVLPVVARGINPLSMKTQKAIKLKDGSTLPKGLPVTFCQDNPSRCLVQGDRLEPYRVRVTSAFRAPSIEALSEDTSVCESVAGETVEPDGWDSHGSPSWMLALGVI